MSQKYEHFLCFTWPDEFVAQYNLQKVYTVRKMRISTKSTQTQTECIHIWHYFITVRSFPYVSCDRSVCFLHWKKLKPLNTVRKKWKLVKLKFFRKNLTIFYINMKHPDLKRNKTRNRNTVNKSINQ
jgi:hypothetical protein